MGTRGPRSSSPTPHPVLARPAPGGTERRTARGQARLDGAAEQRRRRGQGAERRRGFGPAAASLAACGLLRDPAASHAVGRSAAPRRPAWPSPTDQESPAPRWPSVHTSGYRASGSSPPSLGRQWSPASARARSGGWNAGRSRSHASKAGDGGVNINFFTEEGLKGRRGRLPKWV
ncbi:Hypothetical predicted protein [Marmota monax]|uniref:Uncharacterized protein n=1 Tax=Marmota monax TaxID=9995 RepID=A0A5E4CK32_MARMO|nr:Hypothetical predicted protein [Marmota monax]